MFAIVAIRLRVIRKIALGGEGWGGGELKK